MCAMRSTADVCGCFPTGRHYPGIADRLSRVALDVAGLWSGVAASTSWLSQKLAVIDFETTGLSPETDRVIEVGVVCFDNGVLSAHRNWLINPGIAIPEESRAVHKITDEELAGAPSFVKALPEIADALRGHLPVAYNAQFDRRFLYAEAERSMHKLDAPLPPALEPDVVWIDPLVWARELMQSEKSKKLTDVAARLGIALDQAHRAAGDAEATGRVLIALADKLPTSYGELIRLQTQYGARQEVDFAASRNRFR